MKTKILSKVLLLAALFVVGYLSVGTHVNAKTGLTPKKSVLLKRPQSGMFELGSYSATVTGTTHTFTAFGDDSSDVIDSVYDETAGQPCTVTAPWTYYYSGGVYRTNKLTVISPGYGIFAYVNGPFILE